MEELTGKSFLHGEVVGTGIYVIRHFQEGDEEEPGKVMDGLGLLFRPSDYGISKEEFTKTLLHMKKYASYKEVHGELAVHRARQRKDNEGRCGQPLEAAILRSSATGAPTGSAVGKHERLWIPQRGSRNLATSDRAGNARRI